MTVNQGISATQHPWIWPRVDLVFCSSRWHINRGIIPLMLKLIFVHILLASTWVADTADKWPFPPTASPTKGSTNQKSLATSVCYFSAYDLGGFKHMGRLHLHLGCWGRDKSVHAHPVTDDPRQSFQSCQSIDWLSQEWRRPWLLSDLYFKLNILRLTCLSLSFTKFNCAVI